jgi:RND family efflux transporter MFP subunit
MIQLARQLRIGVWLLAATLVACAEPPTEEVVEAETEVAGGGAITIWTEAVELFFEHPPLLAGQESEPWAVHLTDLSDFTAVTEGALVLIFEGDDVHEFRQAAPSRPGVFDPAVTLPRAGMYDLVVALEGGRISDEIFVGPIQVFGGADDLPVLSVEPPVGISFLKEQQWPIEFETVEVAPREVHASFRVTGEVFPPPNHTARLSAPADGIVRAEDNRLMPVVGDRVSRGETLAVLSPVGGPEAFSALQARVERLRIEVDRSERLFAADAIPRRRLDEARHDLGVAEAELDALGGREGDAYRLAVRSPIDGVLASRSFLLGERVEAGQMLSLVTDPSLVWVRLDLPPGRVDPAAIAGATLSGEGSIEAVRARRVVSVGPTVDPTTRAIPVVVEVANPGTAFPLGALVTGWALVGEPVRALAVPSAAVVDEDGVLVSYVQIAGESFERRAVEVGATDGEWTIVLSGVRRGERVVTRGQYPIKLSSLNTSEISDHGHPH